MAWRKFSFVGFRWQRRCESGQTPDFLAI